MGSTYKETNICMQNMTRDRIEEDERWKDEGSSAAHRFPIREGDRDRDRESRVEDR